MSLRIDVIRLAGDAGFTMGACGIVSPFAEGEDLTEQLTRLVDLVQAAEREACAKLCDARKDQSRNHLVRSGLAVAALDIRARGTP